MLFCAMRAADCLNVFVGLWLVPKYVEPSELGAVMPLTQLANFFAIPIAVFASTFRNELTTLAINRKFGQMKTLMRGVFTATAIFLFLAIVICRLVLPAYIPASWTNFLATRNVGCALAMLQQKPIQS